MHENRHGLAGDRRGAQFAFDPTALVGVDPEIGTALPCRDDIEEQAAIAGDRVHIGRHPRGDRAHRGQVAGLEIMIARQHVPRQGQPGHRVRDPGILVVGAVIGIVAGQQREVDRVAEVRVCDRDQVAKPRQSFIPIGLVDVQIAKVNPGQASCH